MPVWQPKIGGTVIDVGEPKDDAPRTPRKNPNKRRRRWQPWVLNNAKHPIYVGIPEPVEAMTHVSDAEPVEAMMHVSDAELLDTARDRPIESELFGDEADGVTSSPLHKCVFGFKCKLCELEKQLEESLMEEKERIEREVQAEKAKRLSKIKEEEEREEELFGSIEVACCHLDTPRNVAMYSDLLVVAEGYKWWPPDVDALLAQVNGQKFMWKIGPLLEKMPIMWILNMEKELHAAVDEYAGRDV